MKAIEFEFITEVRGVRGFLALDHLSEKLCAFFANSRETTAGDYFSFTSPIASFALR